jgi:hypothetical protein
VGGRLLGSPFVVGFVVASLVTRVGAVTIESARRRLANREIFDRFVEIIAKREQR